MKHELAQKIAALIKDGSGGTIEQVSVAHADSLLTELEKHSFTSELSLQVLEDLAQHPSIAFKVGCTITATGKTSFAPTHIPLHALIKTLPQFVYYGKQNEGKVPLHTLQTIGTRNPSSTDTLSRELVTATVNIFGLQSLTGHIVEPAVLDMLINQASTLAEKQAGVFHLQSLQHPDFRIGIPARPNFLGNALLYAPDGWEILPGSNSSGLLSYFSDAQALHRGLTAALTDAWYQPTAIAEIADTQTHHWKITKFSIPESA